MARLFFIERSTAAKAYSYDKPMSTKGHERTMRQMDGVLQIDGTRISETP